MHDHHEERSREQPASPSLPQDGDDAEPSVDLKQEADTLRGQIEDRLEQLLSTLSYPHDDAVPSSALMHATVDQAIESDRGGKRLRALLLLAAGGLVAHPVIDRKALLDLACSIEIFQTGALVHDDIMDESTLRRGRPAAHVALADSYRRYLRAMDSAVVRAGAREGQEERHEDIVSGRGLGIMLGDLLATVSLIAAQDAVGETVGHGVLSVLLDMQREVEIGQVLDEANSAPTLRDPAALIANCRVIYRRKTASYTTIAPLRIGLLACGLDSRRAGMWARRIGEPLGIAFQLRDDLADLLPSTPPTGKPLGGDIREGKRTMVFADALRLLASSSPASRDRLLALYCLPERSEKQVHEAHALILDSGAVQTSRLRIGRLAQLARDELDGCLSSLPHTASGEKLLRAIARDFVDCSGLDLGSMRHPSVSEPRSTMKE